jgi:hypothetical protein
VAFCWDQSERAKMLKIQVKILVFSRSLLAANEQEKLNFEPEVAVLMRVCSFHAEWPKKWSDKDGHKSITQQSGGIKSIRYSFSIWIGANDSYRW